VQLLLIRIGPHQIQMKQKKMSCIALVLLDRYLEVHIIYLFFNSEYSCVLYSSITELCDEYTSLRLHAPARLLSFWSFATLLINLGVSFFMV
jgi:hypothetical protein